MKVLERFAIIAAPAIRARERGEEIGVLAGGWLGAVQRFKRFRPRATPREGHAEANERVDIVGMLAQHSAKVSFSLLGLSETQRQPGYPQTRIDVGRIELDYSREQCERLDGLARPGEAFGAAAVRHSGLERDGQHGRRGERQQHRDEV
jgi:hypothetical protein